MPINPNLTALRVVRGSMVSARDYFLEARDNAQRKLTAMDEQIALIDEAIRENYAPVITEIQDGDGGIDVYPCPRCGCHETE